MTGGRAGVGHGLQGVRQKLGGRGRLEAFGEGAAEPSFMPVLQLRVVGIAAYDDGARGRIDVAKFRQRFDATHSVGGGGVKDGELVELATPYCSVCSGRIYCLGQKIGCS